MGKLPYKLEDILHKIPFEYYDIVLTSIYKIVDSTEQLEILYNDNTVDVKTKRTILFQHRVLLLDTKRLLRTLLGDSDTPLQLSYSLGLESQLLQTHEMLLELN